jgi:cytosine/adenosine deaminase-related metal-dependent hydrolase
MPVLHRAAWVLPIAAPPIRDGWVLVDGGRIIGTGGPDDSLPPTAAVTPGDADATDSERRAILPGLVNAHTHLELSYLHGRIPAASRFGDWIGAVMSARREYPDPADPTIVGAAARAIDGAHAAGTALFGDVSNTLVTVPLLCERGLPARVFYELTGFTESQPEARVAEARARADAATREDVRISVAPHAPYSVSAALFRAIRADLDAHPDAIASVHLGEPPEEDELLRRGTGPIRAVLESLGRWPADWRPPGVGAVEYLNVLSVLDARMLAVHGVQFDRDDLARLRGRRVPIVTCPRSNVQVGVGSPPLQSFYDMKLDVAIGTDSLASAPDLNVFAELRESRRIAPRVAARRLLASATLVGARMLGFGHELGSIEPGKRAALLSVRIPNAGVDVEEYLVGERVSPSDIRWLDAG